MDCLICLNACANIARQCTFAHRYLQTLSRLRRASTSIYHIKYNVLLILAWSCILINVMLFYLPRIKYGRATVTLLTDIHITRTCWTSICVHRIMHMIQIDVSDYFSISMIWFGIYRLKHKLTYFQNFVWPYPGKDLAATRYTHLNGTMDRRHMWSTLLL
jgi:hypothetical protein